LQYQIPPITLIPVYYVYLEDINTSSEIPEGYCQEDGKFYKQGWKFFSDLDWDEFVATLNPETKEKEWQLPTAYQVYDHNGERYEIELEDGSTLLVSPEHKVYAKVEGEKNPNTLSLSIDPIVMVKVLENDYAAFESEGENKASDLNSFEVTQVMPEILEVIDLLSDGNCEVPVLSSKFIEDLLQSGRDIKGDTHFKPISSSSSSKVIRECGPFSIRLSFLTYSSLKGSSSTGTSQSCRRIPGPPRIVLQS